MSSGAVDGRRPSTTDGQHGRQLEDDVLAGLLGSMGSAERRTVVAMEKDGGSTVVGSSGAAPAEHDPSSPSVEARGGSWSRDRGHGIAPVPLVGQYNHSRV